MLASVTLFGQRLQRYQAPQAIYDSEKKRYNKVSECIDIIVCQEFNQHYLGEHTVRSKLITLAESIEPTVKYYKQNANAEFEKLKRESGRHGKH